MRKRRAVESRAGDEPIALARRNPVVGGSRHGNGESGPSVAVKKGHYGPVYLLAWYDDDEGPGEAVIYLGKPFGGPALYVPRKYLCAASVLPLEVARWIKDRPDLAAAIGVEMPKAK